MKKTPPTYFFPRRPIKTPKSYDLLAQMIMAGMAIMFAIAIIKEKGCNNETNMEHKDKTVDFKS